MIGVQLNQEWVKRKKQNKMFVNIPQRGNGGELSHIFFKNIFKQLKMFKIEEENTYNNIL